MRQVIAGLLWKYCIIRLLLSDTAICFLEIVFLIVWMIFWWKNKLDNETTLNVTNGKKQYIYVPRSCAFLEVILNSLCYSELTTNITDFSGELGAFQKFLTLLLLAYGLFEITISSFWTPCTFQLQHTYWNYNLFYRWLLPLPLMKDTKATTVST